MKPDLKFSLKITARVAQSEYMASQRTSKKWLPTSLKSLRSDIRLHRVNTVARYFLLANQSVRTAGLPESPSKRVKAEPGYGDWNKYEMKRMLVWQDYILRFLETLRSRYLPRKSFL